MIPVKPLPAYLIQRFHGWKATTYQGNRAWYRRLAESGQHPARHGDFLLRQPRSRHIDLRRG